jgi:DNA-binding NarL/FixJ family response regulator
MNANVRGRASAFARKVLLVDDEPIIRNLIAERLEQHGFQAFTAADALSAKRIVLREDPDALVVDLDLGDGPSGIELINALNAINPALGFVLLTNYIPTASELRSAKHIEYLNKRDVSDVDLIVSAINRVLTDGGQPVLPDSKQTHLGKLTRSQIEVLELLSRGLTNQQIALERSVGLRAIEQTIRRIYLALGIGAGEGKSSRVTAARIYATEMGLRSGKR